MKCFKAYEHRDSLRGQVIMVYVSARSLHLGFSESKDGNSEMPEYRGLVISGESKGFKIYES